MYKKKIKKIRGKRDDWFKKLGSDIEIFANKNRLAILDYLKTKKIKSVGDIADNVKISFKAASKHLLSLTKKGILKRRSDGPFVLYGISDNLSKFRRSIISGLTRNKNTEANRPKIEVGAIIRKNNKVLLGKRKNFHGEESWSFPGGHLKFGESVEECAKRAVFKETRLIMNEFKKTTFINDVFTEENEHYVTLFVVTDLTEGEPEIREPEKCEEWRWFEWSELPKPLFLPIRNLLKKGFDPFKD